MSELVLFKDSDEYPNRLVVSLYRDGSRIEVADAIGGDNPTVGPLTPADCRSIAEALLRWADGLEAADISKNI